MKWPGSLFRNKDRQKREEILSRLEELRFYRYPDDRDPVSSKQNFIKHGGTVRDLFLGTGRLFSALYKEQQGFPWIKTLLADASKVLDPNGIKLAVKRELKECRTVDRESGKTLTVMRAVGSVIDIENPGSNMLHVSEEFSLSRYRIQIGDMEWIVWDRNTPPEKRSILERQRVLDILSDLFEKYDSEERIWHCWGEKGGESLFIFLTPDIHSIITEGKIIPDLISPGVTESPWGSLEWEFSE